MVTFMKETTNILNINCKKNEMKWNERKSWKKKPKLRENKKYNVN